MKDIPIIFSAPMVCALLSGQKTMTRRLSYFGRWTMRGSNVESAPIPSMWAKVQPGDRLWVRENFSGPWAQSRQLGPRFWSRSTPIWYWADGDPQEGDWCKPRPSIHLPRQFSRLTLTITSVKTERLQNITEADARAEGAGVEFRKSIRVGDVGEDYFIPVSHRGGFANLWSSLNGSGSWEANPEVVALSFQVSKINIDEILRAA
jgi:hypothetical protein